MDSQQLLWLLGPLIGAVIGYITNDIAVRMLFRPREPKYLFGRKIPLTPGLIPKSRYRLSESVGGLVGRELLSGAVLQRALLSTPMMERISQAIDDLCSNLTNNTQQLRTMLPVEPETLEATIDEVTGHLSTSLAERLINSGFETTLAEHVMTDLRTRIASTPFAPLRLFWDDRFQKTMVERLAKAIRDMVSEHGEEWITMLIKSAVTESLDTPISEWFGRIESYLSRIKQLIISIYERIVREQLDHALSAIDLGAILRTHIDSLDMVEMEHMIISIMKRELRAIVWLGALLGGIMGLVNAIIPMITQLF